MTSAIQPKSSVAAPPGPPSRKTTGSARTVGPVAGRTATRRSIVRPAGVARSSGTDNVPQTAAALPIVQGVIARPASVIGARPLGSGVTAGEPVGDGVADGAPQPATMASAARRTIDRAGIGHSGRASEHALSAGRSRQSLDAGLAAVDRPAGHRVPLRLTLG